MPTFRVHLWGAVLLTLSVAPIAWGDPDCLTDPPLAAVSGGLTEIPELGAPDRALGSAFLPVSADRPDLITAARLRVSLSTRSSAHVLMTLDFDFVDPLPWGLPFSFQGAKLTYALGLLPEEHVLLDWSEACENVGWSYFPRQSRRFEIEIPVPDSGTGLESNWLRRFELRIWGSRN